MFRKKHFVLAALILALGAAVYLNWQFSPSESLITDTLSEEGGGYAEQSSTEYVAAVSQASSSDALMNEAGGDVAAAANANYFEQARNDRKKARDESLATLQDIIDDASLDSTQKAQAVNTAAQIAENIEKESAIETLIKSKGYSDCVVVISDTQINVIIPTGDSGITTADAAIIKDIVVGQIEISPSCIKIIEAK